MLPEAAPSALIDPLSANALLFMFTVIGEFDPTVTPLLTLTLLFVPDPPKVSEPPEPPFKLSVVAPPVLAKVKKPLPVGATVIAAPVVAIVDVLPPVPVIV